MMLRASLALCLVFLLASKVFAQSSKTEDVLPEGWERSRHYV